MASQLTAEEIDAWNMWVNKQHGIMPNQYHWTYDQGDTLLFPEHIQDLLTIDKMWNNKMKKEQQKAEAKAKHTANNPLKNQKIASSGGFYNQTYKYK